MSILGNLFGSGNQRSPQDAANKYLNQIPGVGHDAYDPYINQGRESGANAHSQYESMINDPQGFINNILNGYKESEGYQYQKGQLEKSLSNTAAAGGIRGTPQDQLNQGEGVQKLLSADQQQWLTNVLGRYDKGLGGEEVEAERGYNASGNLADILGGNLNQQGEIAFNDQQQKNKSRSDTINALIKAFGTAGGFLVGGPAGAAAGGGLADLFSHNGRDAGPMDGSSYKPWHNPG